MGVSGLYLRDGSARDSMAVRTVALLPAVVELFRKTQTNFYPNRLLEEQYGTV